MTWLEKKIRMLKHVFVCPACRHIVSYLLLGKLGTRQYFQNVSGWEILQSTEEGHKNDTVYMKERICKYESVRPACRHLYMSYLLLGKLGTGSIFKRFPAEKSRNLQKWHKRE
jgi:hypothetical protein